MYPTKPKSFMLFVASKKMKNEFTNEKMKITYDFHSKNLSKMNPVQELLII